MSGTISNHLYVFLNSIDIKLNLQDIVYPEFHRIYMPSPKL